MNQNQIGIKGRFHPQIIDKDGSVIEDFGEQDNLITDQALAIDAPFYSAVYLCLGSGVVTAPSVSDTNLGNQVASVGGSINRYGASSFDATGFHVEKYGEFQYTDLIDPISELGLRKDGAAGTLITRALIKDTNGNPTTITVGAGQTLKLTYRVYFFIPYILGSGVTPTPHGDLHWELRYSQPLNASGLTYARAGATHYYGWFYHSSDTHYKIMAGVNLTNLSQTVDTVNRTKVMTGTTALLTAEKVMAAGDIFWDSGRSNYSGGGHSVFLTQPFTVPANYNFTMTIEISWGRLP
jgi:hypothetical protein